MGAGAGAGPQRLGRADQLHPTGRAGALPVAGRGCRHVRPGRREPLQRRPRHRQDRLGAAGDHGARAAAPRGRPAGPDRGARLGVLELAFRDRRMAGPVMDARGGPPRPAPLGGPHPAVQPRAGRDQLRHHDPRRGRPGQDRVGHAGAGRTPPDQEPQGQAHAGRHQARGQDPPRDRVERHPADPQPRRRVRHPARARPADVARPRPVRLPLLRHRARRLRRKGGRPARRPGRRVLRRHGRELEAGHQGRRAALPAPQGVRPANRHDAPEVAPRL